MPEFSDTVINLAKATLGRRAAPDQGGLLNGQDPSAFNTADPLRLWIIQVGVIVLTTQLLALGLGKIRQPKVIAEVIGGIILGPTAFGRIPGFTQHVFPLDSRPYLSLVANIGLCLFLFLVGLEIDAGVIKRNARLSITVALAGMTLPFGFGAGLSVPLYHHFIDPAVKFTHFMLFTGVAYSITAFPVLCRILTELKLLDTTVGIVVLSAGVGNDIVGWTLLALSVALVNAGSGLMALWILLTCVGWALFLLFPVKMVLRWLSRRTGSVENGPTMFFMTVTILILFGSAFMTDVIGVHAIFGAFLTGIIVPREGGLAIALTEKLEDMVSIIFLPLYFTLSGLSTDLGLLNNGITWAFTIAICSLAYSGKFGGCTLAARYAGFSWREASTIGSLMSCKGLVELIVLNVGLSAGILNQRVFSMFVLEALLLTFMTTPAVVMLYPPEMRTRVSATGATFANVPHGQPGQSTAGVTERSESGFDKPQGEQTREEGHKKTRFTVILDKIEHLPGMMALAQLIQPPPPAYSDDTMGSERGVRPSSSSSNPALNRNSSPPEVSIDALRLIELSDRTSAVMKSSVADTLIHTDPILGIFRTFGDLNGMHVSTSLAIVPHEEFSPSVANHAAMHSSQLVLVPWLPPHQPHEVSADTHVAVAASATPNPGAAISEPVTPRLQAYNPFDGLFKGSGGGGSSASAIHSHFVRSVFAQSKTDVALFVDRHIPGDFTGITRAKQHLFLPFFGGPDDRLALEFVVQLCAHPRVSATVVRVTRRDFELQASDSLEKPSAAHLGAGGDNGLTVASATAFPDTVYGNATTQTRLQSETADNITWSRYAAPTTADAPTSALSRINFTEVMTPTPLRTMLNHASTFVDSTTERGSRLLIVVGRSRRLAAESHHAELKKLLEEHGHVGNEVKKTVGDVGAALVGSGCKASIVVLQAANVDLA